MNTKMAAIEIVKTLNAAGYVAYFAGGWVRDLIMQHPSDDIDIATDASPEIILTLFPHTVKIGLAFGVVLVIMHGHPFEVASFRKDVQYEDGRRPTQIELSSAQEDALRRDFTINGLFYDPIKEEIYDYVNGISDIQKGIIRTIGDPHERFTEDRLRMIRAIRFASRFSFSIEQETQQAIKTHAPALFPSVAMERVWQEFHKMAKFPLFAQAVLKMHHLELLSVIFPALQSIQTPDLEKRVDAFHHFPKNTPPILYLMELFPNMPLEELLELCEYFRTSAHEGRIVEYAFKGRALLEQEQGVEDLEWVYFYANPFFQNCFEALIARYAEEEKRCFTERHFKRRERLLPHIQRVVERKPLVSAAILKEQGILPGKLMGELLREAERIAISQDLQEVGQVMKQLRHSALWPKADNR